MRPVSRFFSFCLLAGLMSLCPFLVMAQVGEPRSDFAVGVNGGYAMNRVSFNPTIKQAMKGGETFGVTIRYTCEKYYTAICALTAEVNFANLGWKEVIETSTDTYSRDINYVQVPLMARMGWGKEERGLMFFIQAGPQFSYFLGQKHHKAGEWSAQTLALRPNRVTAQYDLEVENKFEYGLTGGLGLELSTGIGHFMMEGRYYYGLSDIFHNSKKAPFGRSANGVIFIKGTYLFDLFTPR